MKRKVFGIFLIVLGVFLIFGFLGNLRILFTMYKSNSVDEFSKYNFTIIIVSILLGGLLLIYRGLKWSTKKIQPNYQYSILKVILGNLFYVFSFFMMLTSLITVLKGYFLKESFITPIITFMLFILLLWFAKKWTAKQVKNEIETIGKN